MDDAACVAFLQWALPRMGMRWRGYRRVRRQVCRRIRRRMADLGLRGADEYRRHLEAHPGEWELLERLCRVTISRFARDREVFRRLAADVLPRWAAAVPVVRAWSAGCASGEEPYTLLLHWRFQVAPRHPRAELRVLATDIDAHLLERAREARYPRSSLRELDDEWIEAAFEPVEATAPEEEPEFRLRPRFREGVGFHLQDVRREMPKGRFHLVLCRNLVFTYFEEEVQAEILEGIVDRLEPGGFLVVGAHEEVPKDRPDLERVDRGVPIYRYAGRDGSGARGGVTPSRAP